MQRRLVVRVLSCIAITAFFLGLLRLDRYGGWYAAKALLQGRGSLWHDVSPEDKENPPWLNLALRDANLKATPGKLIMREIGHGAQAGELPVELNGTEVDRIFLLRFSQKDFSLSVNNDPSGGLQVDAWLKTVKAAAVINGSYYGSDRRPATPTISNGAALGPSEYRATNGALVSRGGEVRILNLATKDWKEEFKGANQAFVSYPLLVSAGKSMPNKAQPFWLANRSFVAVDEDGFIVLGTTNSAFFSLPRLAEFLGKTPLRLVDALNLDGGPVACQATAIDGFKRSFCGEWEITTQRGGFLSLKPVVPGMRWNLPIAIGIHRR